MLTVDGIRRWKPKRERDEWYDGIVPGFCVRAGKDPKVKSLYASYTHQGRRRRYFLVPFAVVDKGVTPLAEIRAKALEIWNQARQGRDPAAEQKAAGAVARAETAGKTFGAMIEIYDKRKLAGLRTGRETRMTIDKHLMPRWRDMPLPSITRAHVREAVVEQVDLEQRANARRLLEICKAFFSWAIEHDGITENPAGSLRAATLIGEKTKRDRVLTDQEWRALFRALPGLGKYPYAPFVEILARTGLRRSEVAGAEWSEIDLERKLWTISATRIKNGAAFVVPLVPEVIEILESLPRLGKFLFTTNDGRSSISGFSDAKDKIDAAMAHELGTVPPWTFHDIRRSCRTQWSSLPIPGGDLVRELMLAHARPNLHAVYDLFAYLDERLEGYKLWQQRLQSILENRTASVSQFQRRA
jgi:integrase